MTCWTPPGPHSFVASRELFHLQLPIVVDPTFDQHLCDVPRVDVQPLWLDHGRHHRFHALRRFHGRLRFHRLRGLRRFHDRHRLRLRQRLQAIRARARTRELRARVPTNGLREKHV